MLIGITGSFGSGKSTVVKILEKKGARCVDADILVRDMYKKASPVYEKLVDNFGKDILKNGEINRSVLAGLVFSNKAKLMELNRIVHPAVAEEIKKIKKQHGITIVEVPLLFEANMQKMFDLIIDVHCDHDSQIKRLMKKGYSASRIIGTLHSQFSTGKKMALADYVIDNSKSLSITKKQVDIIWKNLKLRKK
jgi:dephospho-CoA kinase